MSSNQRRQAPLLTALLACASITAVTTAHAHQVWLENTGGQARLHFGEFNDNLRESSPGNLDKFKGVPVLEQTAGTHTHSAWKARWAKTHLPTPPPARPTRCSPPPPTR